MIFTSKVSVLKKKPEILVLRQELYVIFGTNENTWPLIHLGIVPGTDVFLVFDPNVSFQISSVVFNKEMNLEIPLFEVVGVVKIPTRNDDVRKSGFTINQRRKIRPRKIRAFPRSFFQINNPSRIGKNFNLKKRIEQAI
jgi:hypothetical protein